MKIHEEIPESLAGERLDRVVAMLADVSRNIAGVLLGGGFVTLDGEPASTGKVKLRAGQQITIDPSGVPVVGLPEADESVAITVVHTDDHIIVIDKQAGLVVHPATGNEAGTLVNGLLAVFPEIAEVGDPARPGIVHRLDVGTSGLMAVARTQVAYEFLVDRLKRHQVEREYRALSWGHPESNHGLIDAPIGRDPRDPLKMAVASTGRSARTRFEVVERFDNPPVSLITCHLETGRTHQIRVHLTAIGHPVVGDPGYGGRRPSLGLHRPFLHAARLRFEHPVTGDPLDFSSEMPSDLVDVLAACEH